MLGDNKGMIESFISSFVLGLSLLLGFGPQNLFVLQSQAGVASRAVAVGVCTLCDTFLIMVGMMGVGAWLGREPLIMSAVGYLGAMVLIRLAMQTLHRATTNVGVVFSTSDNSSTPVSILPHALVAASVSLLNPAAVLDTLIVMSSFITHVPEPLQPVAAAGAVTASALWFAFLAVMGRVIMVHLRHPFLQRCFNLFCAFSLLGTGLTMAVLATRELLTLGSMSP